MSMRLQTQIAVDEEAIRRFGEDYKRSITRSAYSALADQMIESRCVTEEIIDPYAGDDEDVFINRRQRYFRFSVLVGDIPDVDAVVAARGQGRREAIKALKSLLKSPIDYDGEVRGYLSRWLENLPDEVIAFEVARLENK